MRAAAALLLTLVFCGTAQARDIYVVNHASIDDTKIQAALPVFQQAIDQDFAPVWNATATLKFGDPPAGQWSIELLDTPDCWFCAGYHAVQDGVPYAQVGAPPDNPRAWQTTLTHELWEMLADPFINRTMVVSPSPKVHKVYALETADPVEGDAYAYQRQGVWISDFVTEAWFRRGSKGPWDFTSSTTKPLQLLKDGYQLVWTGLKWIDLFPRGVA